MRRGLVKKRQRLIEELRQSEFFLGFRDAFEGVTGLEVSLLEVGGVRGELDCIAGEGPSPEFCRLISGGAGGCGWRLSAIDECARDSGGGCPTENFQCPAGLIESRVPVIVRGLEVAALAAGRVMVEGAGSMGLDRILAGVRERRELDEDEEALLREAYEDLRRMGERGYRSSVALLEYFALQLGAYGDQLGAQGDGGEPEQVRRALDYVAENLRDDFQLGDIARAAGASPYHLCRIFKASRGMTLTEHVNRMRIDAAKRLLSDRSERVGRVAYEVGYRSLSQFNRAFLRYEGRSPTAWRSEPAPRGPGRGRKA
jgi:AraC-like DNA-binding protein